MYEYIPVRQYPRNCVLMLSCFCRNVFPRCVPRCVKEPSDTLAVRMRDSSPVASDNWFTWKEDYTVTL